MNAAEADKLKQLLHAKKFEYKIWITLDSSSIFGYVTKVTEERVFLREADMPDISVDKIKTIRVFYGEITLDELDS